MIKLITIIISVCAFINTISVCSDAGIERVDRYSRTPLHNAIIDGDMRVVRQLLNAGANIHAVDGSRRTPLHWAADTGNGAIIQLLIARGAQVDAKDWRGNIPLRLAVTGPKPAGSLDAVKILITAGSDVNATAKDYAGDDGRSILHDAARKGNAKIITELIRAGAKVNARDNNGETPLYWALGENQTQAALALVNAGAELNIVNNTGYHPIEEAIAHLNVEMVTALVDAGARIVPEKIRIPVVDDGGIVTAHLIADILEGKKGRGKKTSRDGGASSEVASGGGGAAGAGGGGPAGAGEGASAPKRGK
jgi:cytohesin